MHASLPFSPGDFNSANLLTVIPALAAQWREGRMDDAEFAGSYFLMWQIAENSPHFASRRHKNLSRPDATHWLADLIEPKSVAARRAALVGIFNGYQFRGVCDHAVVALLAWLEKRWQLQLIDRIVDPFELLTAQARGTRWVTAITAFPEMTRHVLAKPNGFAFFIHDLEHAYKFFADPLLYAGQQQLFARLLAAVNANLFAAALAEPEFRAKFNYLISDMNTHPLHGLRFLIAITIEYYLSREGKSEGEQLSIPAQKELVQTFERAAALWQLDPTLIRHLVLNQADSNELGTLNQALMEN